MTHDDGRNSGELRTRRGRRGRRWGATLTIVAVTATLTACSSAPAPTAPVATKTATATTPVTAPSPATTTPAGNADITFNVEANKHSTYEQFKGRPRDEQLAFVWDNYELQISDGIAADFFVGVPYGSSQTLDKYNPAIPGVVSKDNNGQEIVNQNIFTQQYAAAQGTDPNVTGTSPANVPLEEKLLSGGHYYPDSKKDPRYAVGLNTVTGSGTTQLITGIDTERVDKFSPLQKGVDLDGQPVEFVDAWVNSEGNTEIERFIYHTFVAKDNQEHSIWLFAGARKP